METNPSQFIQDKARSLESSAGPEVEELKKNLSELNHRVLKTIKERPGTCLLGALAVGFLIGRIVSR